MHKSPHHNLEETGFIKLRYFNSRAKTLVSQQDSMKKRTWTRHEKPQLETETPTNKIERTHLQINKQQ